MRTETMPRRVAFALALTLLLPAGNLLEAQTIPATAEQSLGGALDAPIRIDVFSDFQCPACGVLYLETIRQVLKEYASLNKVCVVYHEFPLAGHTHAREAAKWSLAVQKIGKRQWQAVVDALYSHQGDWSQSGKVESTVAAVLSPDEYMTAKKHLLSPEIEQTIERDIALGKQRQVESTPTMFLYALGREQKVEGGLPYPVLKGFFDRIVR
jgi:protein-disulfide isomerase